MMLATTLRHKQLYFDAYRHLLSKARRDNFETVRKVFGISQEEAEDWIVPMVEENSERRTRVVPMVMRLQLSESFAIYGGIRSTPMTTYQNMLEYKEARLSEGGRAMEKSKLLARMIYSQWLTRALYGEEV
jgi:hypothetical protein